MERVQVRPVKEKSVCYLLLQKWFYDGKNTFKYSRFIHYMDCFDPNGETILWGKGREGNVRIPMLESENSVTTACLPHF